MKPVKLYLDTEFNGFGGELISLALVAERPYTDDWYGFLNPELIKAPIDPWVGEHVIPQLGWGAYRQWFSKEDMRTACQHFLSNFRNPEIVCDWHVDAMFFCQMLQGDDYGSSLDYPCKLIILKTPPGEPVSNSPHNALEDAMALRDWHQKGVGALTFKGSNG